MAKEAELKVGDSVYLRDEAQEPYKTTAPMTIASLNKDAAGVVTAVCKRQNMPVGEYAIDKLYKVDPPYDQLADPEKK